MIIQNIHALWDTVYNQYRTTVYKTLEDPATRKQVVEVVQYLYDKKGRLEPSSQIGQHVDKKS